MRLPSPLLAMLEPLDPVFVSRIYIRISGFRLRISEVLSRKPDPPHNLASHHQKISAVHNLSRVIQLSSNIQRRCDCMSWISQQNSPRVVRFRDLYIFSPQGKGGGRQNLSLNLIKKEFSLQHLSVRSIRSKWERVSWLSRMLLSKLMSLNVFKYRTAAM